MKVTRYPQSCLLLEKDGQKIIIDPGVYFLQHHDIKEIRDVSAVLYTHEHSDHFDPKVSDALKAAGVRIIANDSTAKLIGEGSEIVNDGQQLDVGGFKVTARELPHCLLPDGNAGPQNTGYVIDDILFHPGDGKELGGFVVDSLALPISGPDISVLDAINFAKQLQVKVAIPIHYDAVPASPEVFASYAKRGGLTCEIRILADGESTQL